MLKIHGLFGIPVRILDPAREAWLPRHLPFQDIHVFLRVPPWFRIE